MAKGGLFLHKTRGADVAWRGTCADATWHVRPCGSATQTHASACMARTRSTATQLHADAWVAPHGKMVFRLASDGPTGIVGPCELFRVVTQRP